MAHTACGQADACKNNTFPQIHLWAIKMPWLSQVTNPLPVLVLQSVFSLLPPGKYLLPLTTCNRYQLRDSNGKILFSHYIQQYS